MRCHIAELMQWPITVMTELKMFMCLTQINKSAKCIILAHLFGIQDEAIREQINYVLDENELLGKGPNGTLSLVFDGIKQLNKGEKHLKVTCDNAGGQKLNFMVPGHTKFKCDGSFGLIKRLYRNTTVECVDHVVEVVAYFLHTDSIGEFYYSTPILFT